MSYVYGVDKCKIILLECVNAKNKDELIARKAHYIRELKCLNKDIPNRPHKE